MKYEFKFRRNENVMVYAQMGDDWLFFPAMVLRRYLKEPNPHKPGDPRYESEVQEMYDLLLSRPDGSFQDVDFYVDRLYKLDEELVPRENLIEESF